MIVKEKEKENTFNGVDSNSGDFFEELLEDKQEIKNKNELEILKELFNKNNIETKTELSINQIIVINKKRMISKLLDFNELDVLLDDFMVLSISNKRKGRAEFIEGFKGYRENKTNELETDNKNGMNRLFGKN